MMFGIVNRPVVTLYQNPRDVRMTLDGLVSTVGDEGLYGMVFAAVGAPEQDFVPVRTFYGYTGYVKAKELLWVQEQEAQEWEHSHLMAVGGSCVDVMNIPKVQGVRLLSLYRGSIIRVLEAESPRDGWSKVGLADGGIGYMRREFLWEKEFSQAGAWTKTLVQKPVTEAVFRRKVVEYALTYLGVQYRWGGRSAAGIDCSGYTSVCYMLGGILIYRDARIVEGYPVRNIPIEQKKPGDLLYFPGHIALYVGDGSYLHSTGRAGESGVRMNSLTQGKPDYRKDLAESLYAVGSIFSSEGASGLLV